MDQLPNEIFQLVMNELHPQDMLECIQVCRRWKGFMETTNPFNTIYVGNPRQLGLLLEKAQADNSLSTQVSNFIFDAGFRGDCDVTRIQKYLSHLGVFVCWSYDASIPYLDIVESRPWNQLKHLATIIDEIDDLRYFMQDLCPNLTELVLRAKENLCLSELVPFLKNTPALTTLAVYGIESSIDDLESMHRNLPRLTTLKLNSLYVDRIDLSQLTPIMPATRVSTVHINIERDIEIKLLQYINKKYKNAQNLTYKTEIYQQEPCNEIPKVIMSLGPQLTQLSLFAAFNATDLVGALNETHCRLKVLKLGNMEGIQNALERFTLANGIEILSLDLVETYEKLSLEKLARFSALKHLYFVNQRHDRINLSELFGVLGNQLESLRLCYLTLACTPLTAYPIYKLKKLTLNRMAIPTHLDHFISQSLPHLRDLAFEFCTLHKMHLKLPNISLNHVLVKQVTIPEINKLLVKTLNNGESRFYYAKPGITDMVHKKQGQDFTHGPISTYPPVRSLPFDAYNSAPFATIECRSIGSVLVAYQFG